MSSSMTAAENEALNLLDRRLARQGYRLVRQPERSELPGFLGRLQPDAIAIGRSPNLLIEVLTGRGSPRAETQRLHHLRDLLSSHPDWRLEVVYAGSADRAPEAVTVATIRKAAADVARLADVDARAALLLGWSTLEAATRALEPELATRMLTSGSIVEMLVGQGHLTQEDADALRRIGHARNGLAHGGVDAGVSPATVSHLLDAVSRLARLIEERDGAAGQARG